MKNVGLILFNHLLDFCFEKLYFLQLKQSVCMFNNDDNTILITWFKAFDFIEWSDLNSNSNSL